MSSKIADIFSFRGKIFRFQLFSSDQAALRKKGTVLQQTLTAINIGVLGPMDLISATSFSDRGVAI